MKTNKVIKQENENGNMMAYVVSEIIEIPAVKGFSVKFRSYDLTNGNGGFETKIWIKGLNVKAFDMALGTVGQVKQDGKLMGFEVTSYKTENIVPEMYQYRNFKSNLK